MDVQSFENSFLYKALLVDGWEISNYREGDHTASHNDYLEVVISKSPKNSSLEFCASLFLEDMKVDSRESIPMYYPNNQSKIVADVNYFYNVFDQYSDRVVKAIIQNEAKEMTISHEEVDLFGDDIEPAFFGLCPIENVNRDNPIVACIDMKPMSDNHDYVFHHSIREIMNDVSEMRSYFMDISKIMDASIAHELEQVGQLQDKGNMYYSEFLNKVDKMEPIATYETTTHELFYNSVDTKVTFFDIGKDSITCCAQVNGRSYPIETLPSEISFNGKEDVLSVKDSHSHIPGIIFVDKIKAIDKESCLDKLSNLKESIPKQPKENIQKDVQSR